MCLYFSAIFLTIFAVGIQGSPKTVTVSDLPYFDTLEVILEATGDSKTLVIDINEKSLTINYAINTISYQLRSLSPTNNGINWTPSTFGNTVHTLKDTELEDFDVLNIKINKINGMRSEKIIKVFVTGKIIFLDTRGEAINLYIQSQNIENSNIFEGESSFPDPDGLTMSVDYMWTNSRSYSSFSKTINGNSADFKRANYFIVFVFVLWNFISLLKI